jgi:hypothetical protein
MQFQSESRKALSGVPIDNDAREYSRFAERNGRSESAQQPVEGDSIYTMETKHHDFDNFADYQQKYRENVSRRDCQ